MEIGWLHPTARLNKSVILLKDINLIFQYLCLLIPLIHMNIHKYVDGTFICVFLFLDDFLSVRTPAWYDEIFKRFPQNMDTWEDDADDGDGENEYCIPSDDTSSKNQMIGRLQIKRQQERDAVVGRLKENSSSVCLICGVKVACSLASLPACLHVQDWEMYMGIYFGVRQR